MPRPGEHDHWTETLLTSLEADEHDFQEFKSSMFLVQEGKIVSGFRDALSRQLSAFANGAGGLLFLGIDDDGEIDGGIPVDLRGGGTRAWLEDVIPGLVDPPLSRFNVYEVTRAAEGSKMSPGCAVYVVEVPGSEDAPHQATDKRYFLRIAGKSRPMGHVHIQDVLRRTQHPQVQISRVGPYGEPERIKDDPRGPKAVICFQAFLANDGRPMARHTGVELILPRPLVNSDIRALILGAGEDIRLTQRPGELVFFHYHPQPLFPKQEIFFQQFWVVLHASNINHLKSGQGVIRWRAYADDAPAREGEVDLNLFTQVRRAVEWIEEASGVKAQKPASSRRNRNRRARRHRKDRQEKRRPPSRGRPTTKGIQGKGAKIPAEREKRRPPRKRPEKQPPPSAGESPEQQKLDL